MESNHVIVANELGKRYVISHKQEARTNTLRDHLVGSVANAKKAATSAMRGRLVRMARKQDDFWALDSVSFQINRGEVVGVIGRNGAGKSTLLKILSRITEPTRGSVILRGRVASLLEVGTGFHPELSGRENIYLNGAILGMSRREIRSRFDEIVEFAGVEQFLDTPVKRYSSGMYVRLAFAVAAHLESEILVVDEVLAVGDSEFQKKCLGRLQSYSSAGRTVLFVSHNIAAIQSLCTKGLLLESGRKRYFGDVNEALQIYSTVPAKEELQNRSKWLVSATVSNPTGKDILMGDCLDLILQVRDGLRSPHYGFQVRRRSDSVPVFGFNTEMLGYSSRDSSSAEVLRFRMSETPLLPTEYTFDITIRSGGQTVEYIPLSCSFRVIERDIYGTGKIPFSHSGVMFPNVKLQTLTVDESNGLNT